jgi:hypothetical protein
MPTATLTFNLPDERDAHLRALHGTTFYSILEDIDEHLRRLVKHGGIEKYTATELAEEIRERLRYPAQLVDVV